MIHGNLEECAIVVLNKLISSDNTLEYENNIYVHIKINVRKTNIFIIHDVN